jgi:hypothetical protein
MSMWARLSFVPLRRANSSTPVTALLAARPRKKGDPFEAEQPKIPSKLTCKDQLGMSDQPDFKVDSSVVSVDVAVLDNKGRFIPHIPKGNFRVLEDNVPQQIANFGAGEALMTVCMIIETFCHVRQKVERPGRAGNENSNLGWLTRSWNAAARNW